MEQEKKSGQKSAVKTVIIVLAVLLGLSLAALCGTLIYHKLAESAGATVSVPDNLITPDEDTGGTKPSAASSPDTSEGVPSVDGTAGTSAAGTGETDAAEERKAVSLRLYSRQPEENTAFYAMNLFPGDRETKYFRVQVAYHDKITVRYHADIRPGSEKLAEVLKVKITLLSSGQELYDGLMRDMPESLNCNLSSAESTTEELYYEITAYLDTSVGNAYQNQNLTADFRWWVEETENLDPLPTGDNGLLLPLLLLCGVSGAACLILLLVRKRREEENHG